MELCGDLLGYGVDEREVILMDNANEIVTSAVPSSEVEVCGKAMMVEMYLENPYDAVKRIAGKLGISDSAARMKMKRWGVAAEAMKVFEGRMQLLTPNKVMCDLDRISQKAEDAGDFSPAVVAKKVILDHAIVANAGKSVTDEESRILQKYAGL